MKTLSEAKQQKVVRKILEADVQGACAAWARGRGYWARKFSSISQRSVPDYLFSHFGSPTGSWLGDSLKIKFACEFKRPGAKLTQKEDGTMSMSTEAQHEEQKAMRLAGWYVFECDDVAKFKATVLAYEAEQA